MDVLSKIQGMYNTFSYKEKVIANYIMQENTKINNINIVDLADITGTSGATITRFCKKIGCTNFVDMKIKISSVKYEPSEISEKGLVSSVREYYDRIIERTNNSFSEEDITGIVEEIKNAKKIFLYCPDNFNMIPMEFCRRLIGMGIDAQVVSDFYMMRAYKALVTKDDLIIAITVFGEDRNTIEVLSQCKEEGIKISAISTIDNCSIKEVSDRFLLVCNPYFLENKKIINGHFSTMYLIDLISLGLLDDDKYTSKLKESIESVEKFVLSCDRNNILNRG